MAVSLVLTIIGADRPGLVEALSAIVSDHDGNWLESRMSQLAGKFAGIVRVEAPEERIDALATSLADLESQGLRVVAERGTDTVDSAYTPLRLELVGADHPGIVREVAAVLARLGVNVEQLQTECIDAPMSGEPLFQATARLRLPRALGEEEVRGELEKIAQALMVDVTVAQED